MRPPYFAFRNLLRKIRNSSTAAPLVLAFAVLIWLAAPWGAEKPQALTQNDRCITLATELCLYLSEGGSPSDQAFTDLMELEGQSCRAKLTTAFSSSNVPTDFISCMSYMLNYASLN